MADSAMGKLIPVVLIGAVGYWAYSSGILSSLSSSKTPATTPPPDQTPPPPPPPKVPGPCQFTDVLAPVLAAVQKDKADIGPGLPGVYSIDQYGWYLNNYCTGLPQQAKLTADDLFPDQADRGGDINWNAFVGYAKAAGLSGMRRGPWRLIGSHLVRSV